jgi:hypothetical protein
MAEDELLSQDEIDALLNGPGGDKNDVDTGAVARIQVTPPFLARTGIRADQNHG